MSPALECREVWKSYSSRRVGLKTLLGRLNQDASQFVHDELELAKLELREVADALGDKVAHQRLCHR